MKTALDIFIGAIVLWDGWMVTHIVWPVDKLLAIVAAITFIHVAIYFFIRRLS